MATKAPPRRIVRLPEVVERTGLSRGSVYRLMKLGRFPRSVKLSENSIGWREIDVDAWIDNRPDAA